MKIAKRIFGTILFILLFLACGQFLKYILIDDTTSYTRVMMHELYNQDKNIDILFVGSSHCYRSFDTAVTDEIFQQNTFNAGSSSQTMDASYAIIKEAAKYNDIKQIYLEIYFGVASGSTYRNRNQLTSTYIISDYMRPSLNKMSFLLNASLPKHYINSFILPRRNWENLFDLDYIMTILENKSSVEYKDFGYELITFENEYYAGKGYVASNNVINDSEMFGKYGYEPINIDKMASLDWEKYLYKIIEFCDKNEIELTLVSAPVPDFMLAAYGNYDMYIDKINNMLNDSNVKYYDFNLCKEEYFPCDTKTFQDTDHLNCFGAELFSNLFAQFFTGKISENDLFYRTYKERLEHLPPVVLGLCYKDIKNEETGEIKRNIKIVSTSDINTDYQVFLTPKNGERYMIQDFSENQFFSIPVDEHGIAEIAMRIGDNKDITSVKYIQY